MANLILVRKITNLTGSEDTEESVLVFPTGCFAFTQVFRQTDPEKKIRVK